MSKHIPVGAVSIFPSPLQVLDRPIPPTKRKPTLPTKNTPPAVPMRTAPPDNSTCTPVPDEKANASNYSSIPLPDLVSTHFSPTSQTNAPPMTFPRPSMKVQSNLTQGVTPDMHTQNSVTPETQLSSYVDTCDAAEILKMNNTATIPILSASERRSSIIRYVTTQDFNPPEPNFGTNFCDKSAVELVSKIMEDEINFLKIWKKYFEERCRIESGYAKSLQDLHEKYKPNLDFQPASFSSISSSFNDFMDISHTNIEALQHSSKSMKESTLPNLKNLISGKKIILDLFRSQGIQLEKTRHLYRRKMEESRRQYCDLVKMVEDTKIKLSNASNKGAKNTDNLKKTLLTKSHEMVEAHNSYILALKAYEIFEQWHYSSIYPVFLNSFQRLMLLHTDYFAYLLRSMNHEIYGNSELISELYRKFTEISKPISGAEEYTEFIINNTIDKPDSIQLSYDSTLPKVKYINLLENQICIQNRDTTTSNREDYKYQANEFQKNIKLKHNELSYVDKAFTSRTLETSKDTMNSEFPFDISSLSKKFVDIIFELETDMYKEDILKNQLHLLESALGATDTADIDDNELYERAVKGTATKTQEVPQVRSRSPQLPRKHSQNDFQAKYPVSNICRSLTPEPDVKNQFHTELSIEEEGWYFGEITRESSEKLLENDGDYLVRYSSGQKGYVISTRRGTVKHFVVKKENGQYMFNKQGFTSIKSLLDHQKTENRPLVGDFYLEKPVLREKDRWHISETDIEMRERLGKGNFGFVYKGFMYSRNEFVAIKMCKSEALADQDEFLREAEILKQYRHPNIVEFIGTSAQGDCIYIIMELMSGGDFLTYLRNKAYRDKKFSLTKKVLDVADGMTYLALRLCVHRDLAARNCLISSKGDLKISDFGMSRQLEEGLYNMKSTNKPLPIKWTAPEALHRGIYTTQSDVWSYGILLWEAFSCGSTPYPGMDSKTAIEKIETGFRLPAPGDTPQQVYSLMRECWQYNPDHRPEFKDISSNLKSINSELTSRDI